jgi:hypothetical protein
MAINFLLVKRVTNFSLVSMTQVTNLSLVSMKQVTNFSLVSMTQVTILSHAINDTGKQFFTGINDTFHFSMVTPKTATSFLLATLT